MIQNQRFLTNLTCILLLILSLFGNFPAVAADVSYQCQANVDTVFGAVSQTVQEMSTWRSIRIVESKRTVKAIVRNVRNFGVPLWIQVHPQGKESSDTNSELHVLWEQKMEPLNYPDIMTFVMAFQDRQEHLELGCVWQDMDVGL